MTKAALTVQEKKKKRKKRKKRGHVNDSERVHTGILRMLEKWAVRGQCLSAQVLVLPGQTKVSEEKSEGLSSRGVCVYVHLLPEREGVAAQNIYKWQAKHTKMIPSWDIGARTVMMVWVTCSNGEGVFGVTGHEVALDSVKSHIVSTTGCQGGGEGRGVSWQTSHLGPRLAWSLTGQR